MIGILAKLFMTSFIACMFFGPVGIVMSTGINAMTLGFTIPFALVCLFGAAIIWKLDL